MDDCRNTDSPLGVRAGEQLYHGRVYPYFACARDCSGLDQRNPGPEAWVNDLQVLIGCSYIEQKITE